MQQLRKGTKDIIWKYYAFTFFNSLAFFSAVLIPFFTDWGGINQAQIQILQSWFMFWIFVLEVPTGAIADYLGRKYSMALGGVVVTVAVLVYGSFPDFKVFLLAEFLYAAAVALISGADEALLYDLLKERGQESESKKVFGRVNSFHLAAMLIAAPVGSLIAKSFGLNYPTLFTAIPYFISALIVWSIPESRIRTTRSESTRYVDIVKQGFVFFYNHKQLRKLALDSIIVASSAYFVIWLYQPLLKLVGVDIFYFGFIHAGIVLVQILVSSNFEWFDKIFKSSRRFLFFSAFATAISFLAAAVFPSAITIFLLIVLAGGFGLTRLKYMTAFLNKLIPSSERATILSSISMFRRFALVLLNPIVGFATVIDLRYGLAIAGLLPLTLLFFSPIEQEVFD